MKSPNDFDLNSAQLKPYLKSMIEKLPNAPKLIMQTLSTRDWNKEDLSINSRVRRGELNYAILWLEALGLVKYTQSGRQKLYGITPLGEQAYEDFREIFMSLKEEE
ncbi:MULTISPECIES: hypothetical protein [unclassified Paenibacillus]|uniref:hypothetical protein n=1 Tax=unclassified Paenibacillus TaxID=185978 RepID=UPI0030166F6D